MGATSTRTTLILALAAAFTIYFIILSLALTAPDRPAPFQQTYVNGPVNITGYLIHRPFPARQFVSEEAAHGKPLYSWSSCMAVAVNETSTPFFLFNNEYNGTIWETSSFWPPSFELDLGGLSNWDIYGAYTSQLNVTVSGDAFTLDRLDDTLQCIDVDQIIVHNRTYLPLFVEYWDAFGGKLTRRAGSHLSGANFGVNHIYIGPAVYLNSSSIYKVALVGGDSIRFSAESPQPFSLKMYASLGRTPSENYMVLGSVIYSSENVTSVTRDFTVVEGGVYSFSFYVDYLVSEEYTIDFSAGRLGRSEVR